MDDKQTNRWVRKQNTHTQRVTREIHNRRKTQLNLIRHDETEEAKQNRLTQDAELSQ